MENHLKPILESLCVYENYLKARLMLQTCVSHEIRERCIRIRDVNINFLELSFSEKQHYYKIITATALQEALLDKRILN